MKKKIVYLDRDGIINDNREEYVLDISEFHLIPSAVRALKLLKKNGYDVHIVSNQSSVSRGMLSEKGLERITEHMLEKLRKAGTEVDSVNYCTHHPDEKCRCRKPNTGMLEDVAERNGYNLADIWFVGDRRTDVQAGRRAGCKTILVSDDVYIKTLRADRGEIPDHFAKDLYDAVTRIILKNGI